ncbi:MAG: metallophosphoesterase [Labilithrix sp.]|nr:metallophosphoesterase [Labilithrix sp.]
MKLLAISDLHVRHPDNRAFVERIEARPDDWLVIAGDVGEDVNDLELVLDSLGPKFAKLVWVPGNHELWTLRREGEGAPRGEARYARLVEACRARGVLTPEDPYPVWPGDGPPTVIAPMFLLYDYSFRPDDVPRERAIAWASEADTVCVDEELLHPHPHASREAWCHARVEATRARLDALGPDVGTVLINHFPLRRAHAFLPRVPRFCIWCGTTKTEDWHLRYRARAVVYGHLHIPRTHVEDGVAFEEVSLGYPVQWRGRTKTLRQIWPRPA